MILTKFGFAYLVYHRAGRVPEFGAMVRDLQTAVLIEAQKLSLTRAQGGAARMLQAAKECEGNISDLIPMMENLNKAVQDEEPGKRNSA